MLKRQVLVVVALLAASPLASAQPVATVAIDATPEQRAYESRTDAQIRGWMHEGNRASTEEERTFVDSHWRRAMRIWRARRLAEQNHDMATVARCDALLLRADRILEQQIHHFRDRAPVYTAPPEEALEATVAPPPLRTEVQPARPSGRHMWVPGFWAWHNGRHEWQGGRWAEPPQEGMAWDQPRWESRNGRWAFVQGRWHAAAPPAPTVVYEPPPPPPAEVIVETAPPPPMVEVRPVAPPGGVWIPGYWHWSGNRHVWVGGRWSAARAGYRWEPDRWEHSGRGYRRVPGRWQH